jgi:hypothetical protein
MALEIGDGLLAVFEFYDFVFIFDHLREDLTIHGRVIHDHDPLLAHDSSSFPPEIKILSFIMQQQEGKSKRFPLYRPRKQRINQNKWGKTRNKWIIKGEITIKPEDSARKIPTLEPLWGKGSSAPPG